MTRTLITPSWNVGRACLLALLAFVALTSLASAAEVTVSGRVTRRDGTTPYPGVRVDVTGDGSASGLVAWSATAFTDANGNWSTTAFSFGNGIQAYYKVRFSVDDNKIIFTKPGRITVITGNQAGINGFHLATIPEPGSQVVIHTPGLRSYL